VFPDFRASLTREAWPGSSPTKIAAALLAASKAGSRSSARSRAANRHTFARFAFQLAQAFSGFYQKFHVLDEPDPERKTSYCG